MTKPFLCIAPVYYPCITDDTRERFRQDLTNWGLVKKEVVLPSSKLGGELWQVLDESLIAPVILKINQWEDNNRLEQAPWDPHLAVWLYWSSLYSSSNIVSDLIYPASSWTYLDESLSKSGHEVANFIVLPSAEIVKEWLLRQSITSPQFISPKIKI